MYIRSSPCGPNRDPNRTLSNELLLITVGFTIFIIYIVVLIEVSIKRKTIF